MWHWLEITFDQLVSLLYQQGIIGFFSEPFGLIVIVIVIVAVAYFAFRLPK
jgi:Na+/proline symporter